MSELFEYQRQGAAWLAARKSALLADEMGLGKTAQAITALDTVAPNTVTIVCPASLCANWEREILTWSMGLWDYEIVSYDMAVRHGLPPADAFVFDEAHYLKSRTAKRTKVCLGFNSPARTARYVWGLTGTPAPNNVTELHTWLAFFGVEVRSYDQFMKHFTNYRMTEYGPKIFSNKTDALPELQAIMEPVYLRRRKNDVLKDLPPVRWGTISLAGVVDNDVRQFDAAIVINDELPTEDEHLARLRRAIGEAKAGPLARFLADELTDTADKIVIFAWHKAVLDTLHVELEKFGVARIDGATPIKERQPAVDRFQTDPDCRVFLGNIEAAGTGITLTASASLVFAEMSWTPGHNAQAAMRVHRIGQTNAVLIRVAMLQGSIDEDVGRVLTRKTTNLEQLYRKEAA